MEISDSQVPTGNVMEFDSCQGNVRDFTKNQGNILVRERLSKTVLL